MARTLRLGGYVRRVFLFVAVCCYLTDALHRQFESIWLVIFGMAIVYGEGLRDTIYSQVFAHSSKMMTNKMCVNAHAPAIRAINLCLDYLKKCQIWNV